jgi:tetratricopeptide (TPR) repeat protein/tRNA A-37 threonylcarbamoyl transferase component Bud32
MKAYQAMFPGYEAVIAREYEALERAGHDGGPGHVEADRTAIEGDIQHFGRYRILRTLGRGGQGAVYLAEDEQLKRRVALKVLTAFAVGSDAMRVRLLREAMAASKLDHPGICTVYEVGEERGLPFIAMQFVHGETLASKIAAKRSPTSTRRKRRGPSRLRRVEDDRSGADSGLLTPTSTREIVEAVELVERTARALHVAHQAALIHRDVKPGNIMVTPSGEPVLLDFGLARDEETDDPALTRTGELVGTPAYLAPEQVSGRDLPLDRRADVYALGVTLYECLTARRPFEAATREHLFQRIIDEPPPDPRQFNRRISRDLKAVLEVALEKDRNRRYRTAEDLADDLRRVRRLEPIVARPPGALTRLQRWARRRPAMAMLLAVLAVAVPCLGMLVGYLVANREKIAAAEHQQLLDRVETHVELGFCESADMNDAKAVAHFTAALDLKPDTPEALAGLLCVHLGEEAYGAAVSVCETHRALVDRYPSLKKMYRSARKKSGREVAAEDSEDPHAPPASALEHFLAGVQSQPPCSTRDPAAFRPALAHFAEAIFQARHARALFYVAHAHMAGHAGDVTAVRHSAAALVRLWPDSAMAWLSRGRALARIGEHEAAVAAYRAVLAHRPTFSVSEVHLNIGNNLLKLGRLEEAGAAYRKALALDPENLEIRYADACRLYEQGRREEGEALFRRILQVDPGFSRGHYSLGLSALDQGNLGRAESHLRDALKCEPKFAKARYNLGWVLEQKGDARGAVEAYLSAARGRSGYAKAHEAAARMLMSLDRYREAIQPCRARVALEPDSAQAHFTLGHALARSGSLIDSIPPFKQAVTLDPEHGLAHYELGLVCYALGRRKAAEAEYREAVRIDPGFVPARVNLGTLLDQRGDRPGALGQLREAVRRAPRHARARYNLALILLRENEREAAVSQLKVALEVDPDYAKAHYQLARAYQSGHDLEGAARHFGEAVRCRPDWAAAHCRLGRILASLGELDDALAHLRRGHALGAKSPKWKLPSARWIQECQRRIARRNRRKDS